ncbi:MAG: pyrroloquinoline quinone biosynthesis protein PqqE [Gemmatimonadota bacterium]
MRTDGPLWLLAELTYRCVLQCPYCSNPVDYRAGGYRRELNGEEWGRVLEEAHALGAVQLGLSGGEPTLHRDLLEIVSRAARLGFYSTLVTVGHTLDRDSARALRVAGLDHVQISVQGASEEVSDAIAGASSFAKKLEACELVRSLGFPLTLNVVLHRFNLHQVADLIGLASGLGAERIELANTQYYGWALANRAVLMPTRDQLEAAHAAVERERDRHPGLEIVWVLPDYYEIYPKPCMGGWATRYLAVTPGGMALPCHAAAQVTSLEFPNVRDHPVEWIWYESPAFNAYRGTGWMREPCRSCPRREIDFGGCRCQAFALTGDAARTDPVCHLSPDHHLVEEALVRAGSAEPSVAELVYRNPQSIGRLLPTTLVHPT